MSQNSFELSVEAQRSAAKFTTGLSNGHGLQVVVSIGLPVPTEIDVQEPFTVDAVDHHGVSTCASFRIAGNVHGVAVLQLFVEHVDEPACPFVGFRGCPYVVGKILLEGLLGSVARGRTCTFRVAHVNRCTNVMVQFPDRISFVVGEITTIVTVVHKIPCVARLGEIDLGRISIVGSIGLRACALFGPAVEVHDLRYRRSHTAGGIPADTVIVGIALPPLAFQQRSHRGIAVVRREGGEIALAVGGRQFLHGLKAFAVGFEQVLQAFGGVKCVEWCFGAHSQYGAHGFIAGHQHETIIACVVEQIVRGAGPVRKRATFECALRCGRKSHVLFGDGRGSSETDVTVGSRNRGDSGCHEEGKQRSA